MSWNGSDDMNELKFWLQIMGDHARFIKVSLSQDQTNLILVAVNFIEIYDRLLERVRQSQQVKEEFLNEVLQVTLSFRDFKRELLAERLKNSPVTSLTPTFYNHMLNELEDFLRVLADLAAGRSTTGSIIGQHLLWSLDAAGHAATLQSDLDKMEYKLQDIAKRFEKSFDRFYLRAVEIAGYFRSSPPSVQTVLEAYNLQISEVMKEFMIFLENLKSGLIKQRVLGRLLPLEPDHMFREECYYLHKIAELQPNICIPECDPGRPRVTGEKIGMKQE